MSELAFRTRKILYATVSEYISAGDPVGSHRLRGRYGLDVSPATIRNELADLEGAGYLSQPHTSAGRVPTDKGFRAFVDGQTRAREVDPAIRASICERLGQLTAGMDDFPRETVRLLSAMTGGASVHYCRPAASPVSELHFVVGSDGLLAVLVTKSGQVESRRVQVACAPAPTELERIHNYLRELMSKGELTLLELREAVARAAQTDRSELLIQAKAMVDAACAATPPPEVVVGGQNTLLGQRDFASVDKMRAVLSALEEKERLLELLDRTLQSREVEVCIGTETQLDGNPDLALIAASFGHGQRAGSLAILAPTRVDYQKVVPLVGFAAKALTACMEGKSQRQ